MNTKEKAINFRDDVDYSDNNIFFYTENSEFLAQRIEKNLDVKFFKVNKIVFKDGEIITSADVTVRNKDTFVLCSGSYPVNENIMELFLFIDALKRASAKSIHVILTYFPYARQDRKTKGRQSIGAKLMADFLEKAGATKVTTLDLHNPSIQAFFNIPVDDIKGQFIIADHMINSNTKHYIVVSPDHGGATRARFLAEIISAEAEIAIVDKRRVGTNEVKIYGILGDVKDKDIILIDDIIDTGSTIIKAAAKLRELGAKKIAVAATHGIFSKGFDIFQNSEHIDKVIVTNTVPTIYNLQNEKNTKLHIVCISTFLSQILKANIANESVSDIYNDLRKEILSK